MICFTFFSAELGDFDPVVHTPAFVSEFRFVPVQTEEMEIEILEWYRLLRYTAPTTQYYYQYYLI